MEHSNAALVRHLYNARARNDLDAVRSMLPAEIVWHEPDVDSEHTGDLHDPEAVLEMIWGLSTLPVERSGSCAARSSSTVSTPWRYSTGQQSAMGGDCRPSCPTVGIPLAVDLSPDRCLPT